MRYRLDPGVEIVDGGRGLLGGDPTRLLRLSEAGARVVATWRSEGVDVDRVAPGAVRLVERLVAAGMAHPVPAPVPVGDLVVVVPVRDRPEALDRCLSSLRTSGVDRLVVVDDASVDVARHAEVAARHGAALVRRETCGGPAAARMTGWASLDPLPEFVAFVDSDVVASEGCWGGLLGHFVVPNVGLAAPRVIHDAGTGAVRTVVDRFEAANSPLDLGDRPAAIVAGTRVSYVPAAAMVVRSAAFDQVGGFDERLEVGEDVDLLWRMVGAGWTCRYEPTALVGHTGRARLLPLLRRRFDYGRSAALLDARHPGSLPPLRGSWWSVVVVALFVGGRPFVAAAIVGANVEAMSRKLGEVGDRRRVAARLVTRGHVGFTRHLARALVRPWFPIAVLVSLVSRRGRRGLAVAALVQPLLSMRERRPELTLPVWVALVLADEVAYSAGVWSGCLRGRRVGPLVPDLRRRS